MTIVRCAIIGWILFCSPATASKAQAQFNDPDPAFNGGIIIEDRFAGNSGTDYVAQRIVRLSNGDVVMAGIVPAAFQSTGGNVGLVRYNSSGGRIPWPNPPAPYISFENRYITYPNSTTATFLSVTDMVAFNGLLIVYATNSGADAVLIVFGQDGSFVGQYSAFNTGLSEYGSRILPYAFVSQIGTTFRRLVASATYYVFEAATGSYRGVATFKRFSVSGDGTLSVDTSFGPYGNGANDYLVPDSTCDTPPCGTYLQGASAVRTNTSAPTLYYSGFAEVGFASATPFVLTLNGATGDLEPGFGQSSHPGLYLEGTAFTAPINGALGVSVPLIGVAVPPSPTLNEDRVLMSISDTGGSTFQARVLKLRVKSGLPPPSDGTLPDFSWGDGGTRILPKLCRMTGCANVDGIPQTYEIALDSNRIALAGEAYAAEFGTGGDAAAAFLATIRLSDGALIWAESYPALRSNGSLWGVNRYSSIVTVEDGVFAVTGPMRDLSTSNKWQFGTTRFYERPDFIFANGYE